MSKVKLYEHQKKALEETKGLDNVLFALDMGLGKTFTGSERLKEFDNNINLVVCQKSKIDDWIDHFKTYYQELQVFDLTQKSDFSTFSGQCQPLHANWKCVGVINYDLIWRRKQLLGLKDFTLMLDESSLVQNEKAKRSKFILKMNPSNVIMLSGTVCGGKYENLWTQIHLLGWTISQDTYNKQYINWKLIDDGSGIKHKIVDKDNPYKNVDRLKEKMRQHGAVFMKTEECFDLPEQTFITVNCGSSKEYKKFKKTSVVTIGEIELIGDSTLSKMLYLRMLCGQYNQEKLEAFKDLVESTNDRLIVFYNFNEELKQLKKIAEELERPISEVNGHTKDLDAYEHEDNSITFCQYQAASMGLNLQKANKVIYFTPTCSCEQWMQSQKRIHRINQTKTCFYYQLICKDSIEEKIYEALERGVNFTDELFRG